MLTQQAAIIRTLTTDRAKLMAYIWMIVRDYHLAEDIYQEVLVGAVEKEGGFEDTNHLLSWARVVGRREAVRQVERNARQPLMLDHTVLDQMDRAWVALDQVDSIELRAALHECMNGLTDRTRHLLQLSFGENRTGSEIAQTLGLKRASIYQSMSRAYRTLYDCIRKKTGVTQ